MSVYMFCIRLQVLVRVTKLNGVVPMCEDLTNAEYRRWFDSVVTRVRNTLPHHGQHPVR